CGINSSGTPLCCDSTTGEVCCPGISVTGAPVSRCCPRGTVCTNPGTPNATCTPVNPCPNGTVPCGVDAAGNPVCCDATLTCCKDAAGHGTCCPPGTICTTAGTCVPRGCPTGTVQCGVDAAGNPVCCKQTDTCCKDAAGHG